jgi:hypothetical protein
MHRQDNKTHRYQLTNPNNQVQTGLLPMHGPPAVLVNPEGEESEFKKLSGGQWACRANTHRCCQVAVYNEKIKINSKYFWSSKDK